MSGVLILGATSAIGRAVANELGARGYDLILSGRDGDELEILCKDLRVRYGSRADVSVIDVLAIDTHPTVLKSLLSTYGAQLEGVVLCIGYLGEPTGAQLDWGEARRILDTNYTGCVSILNILANHFEQRRAGFLCALSSVAGDRGRASNYLYGSAKAGLTAYLSGLRSRLSHSGVHVVTVKPGFVDTRATFGRPGLFLVASPQTLGRSIYRAIEKRKNVVYVPWFWRWIMAIIRILPESLFKRLRL